MLPWDVELLSTWRSAGGRPVGHLGPVCDGTERDVQFGDRGTITLVLDRQIAEPQLPSRAIVGITRRDQRDYLEARVMQRRVAWITENDVESERLVVTAYPRIYDLSDTDLVREWIGGTWVYTFDVTLTVRQLLQRFFFVRLEEDRLAGLVLGTAPDDVPLRWQFSRITRGQLLDDALARSFGELRVARLISGAEQLDVVDDLGADATVVPLLFGDRLRTLDESMDWQDCATAYRLAGDGGAEGAERPGFGENAWQVTAVGTPSAGTVAITLREIGGTRHPVFEDGMFAAHPALGAAACYVQRANGLTRGIISASSASAGTVTVPAGAAPVLHEIITLVANADGDPIELLVLPVSAAQHGVIIADQQVPGMRGERNYLANGGHEDGLTGWTSVNGGVGVETTRTELGRTIEFRANGTRAGGTGPGTPFAVDGLTPTTDRLLQGGLIEHIGWQSTVESPAIADDDGVLVLDLDTPIPADYADGAVITMRRRERVTAAVVDGTPKLSGRVMLDVGDADLAQRLAAFARCDRYPFSAPAGDVRVVGPSGEVFDHNWNALHVHEDDPTVLVGQYASFGGSAPTPTLIVPSGVIQFIAPQRVRVYVPDNSIAGTIMMSFKLDLVDWDTSFIPPWLFGIGTLNLGLVGPIVASGTTGGTYGYVDFDLIGLPAATDLTSVVGYMTLPHFYLVSDAWAGSFDLTWLRETRVLELDGLHPSGSTSLQCRPISALARRDWQLGDTMYAPDGLSFAVGGAGAWGSDGIATVPVTVPSGVTLRAGTLLWSNFLGSGPFDALMCVVADVVGPASSVDVRGSDRYPNGWDGTTPSATAVYRVAEATTLDVPGNLLEVAATVTANGSGQANVTLVAANANAIADNALLRMEFPVVMLPTDRLSGSLLRLLCPADHIGQPYSATPGIASPLVWFRCPVGTTRPITTVSLFRLSMADWFAGAGPAVAIVDAAGTILSWAALDEDGILVDSEGVTVTLVAQAIINVSAPYGIRLFGGSADRTLWCLHDQSMFYLGSATDAPYTRGSYASAGLLRCARIWRERSQPRIADTLQLEELSTMYAEALGITSGIPPIVLGGRAHIEERNRLARIVGWKERPGQPIADVQFGQVRRDGARILGDTALALNTRGVR